MAREDLILSAVSFLSAPSVAASPLEQRKAFLKSKNLTEEEIELAFARAGEQSTSANTTSTFLPSQSSHGYQSQRPMRQAPANGYGNGYGPYQGSAWGPHSPEPLRRDWRDWFIMATVTTGVTYGLYTVAKRYIMPLISPPTPPQLEQDKASIDASFTRAFDLIDQLATDTAALKTAETERTEKLDTALQEVESVISELKTANKRREDDSRRIGDEVRALKDIIPKALEGWKAEGDNRLKDLGSELKSLKMLVSNRVGSQTPATATGRPFGSGFGGGSPSGSSTPREPYMSGNSHTTNENSISPSSSSTVTSVSGGSLSKRENPGAFSFDGKPTSRAAIPAWQMAASANANKSKGSSPSSVVNGDENSKSTESSSVE